MNEIYNTKIREAYSSVARSSIRPIFQKISESLVILPGFLIFILTICLVFALNFQVPGYLPAIFDPTNYLLQHHLLLVNFIRHVYLPIILFNFILIVIGLILNLNKRLIIKLGYSKIDITKRNLNVKSKIPNTSKRRFRAIYLPIAVFITYTGILTIISSGSGLNSHMTFNFLIQNYIPVVILCWIAFTVLLLVTTLRKKLRGIYIKKF